MPNTFGHVSTILKPLVLPCFSGETLDVFTHEEAVYGLSVDPVNDSVFASACDDGRILLYDIRAPPSEGKRYVGREKFLCFRSPG